MSHHVKRLARSDSVGAAVQAMANVALPDLEPPEQWPLRDGDWPFWRDIVRARARDSWTPNDLGVAAQLAMCQADIQREQVLLDQETTVVANERGTLVVNARVSVLEQFSRRQMALMRSLCIGGVASGTRTRDQRRALEVERTARSVRDEVAKEEESLLAS